ncbi:hypothetical protein OSB04_004157 [Centaurea solstitialis]|uniref:Uncharacterized protein n=1 Tax=Centaurea solstitialis TaxID=347529 RepID=A0AA38WVV9_9ASTR|nr:hypothetical protein OSB04_004157 [Centaurea solstitialis]
MVAISLYRGKLHRSPDVPRQWLMPTPKISLKDFKTLLHRRSRALSRLQTTTTNPNPNPNLDPNSDDRVPAESHAPPPEDIVAVKDEGTSNANDDDELARSNNCEEQEVNCQKLLSNGGDEDGIPVVAGGELVAVGDAKAVVVDGIQQEGKTDDASLQHVLEV